jgi:transposase-like protein
MDKNIKYTKEFKLKCILEVIEKKEKPGAVVSRYHLASVQNLNNWIKSYEEHGEEHFRDKNIPAEVDYYTLIGEIMNRVSPEDREILEDARMEIDCLKKTQALVNMYKKRIEK